MKRFVSWAVLCSLTALAGCAHREKASVSEKPLGANEAALFWGLGDHERDIGTENETAQAYFNQGLAFLYGFNHDEAIRSFTEVTRLDPQNPMGFWGIAVANGPHINFPFVPEPRAQAAWEALEKARALSANTSPKNQGLIVALGHRYAWPQPADRSTLDLAYANAMRALWKEHPEDTDIGALFAESMMDLRPWDLWTLQGKPQPGTEEILNTLEAVLAEDPSHPLANHLYIHAVEASPHPERALAAADRLRTLQPGLGHMVHMPTHIDVRLGQWQQAIDGNERAIEADRVYHQRRREQDFYRVYMAHNRHLLAFAAMMSGQKKLAREQIEQMVAEMPEAWRRQSAPIADGFIAMPTEVLIRFGEWDVLLERPEPPEYLPVSRAFWHYGRGVAHSAKGNTSAAREAQRAFREAMKRVPPDATFGNNKVEDLFVIADAMLDGEIAYREGNKDEAFRQLRAAVEKEDTLRYDEPPDWLLPTRHALGAALLDSGRVEDAEAVYREDLRKHPENVWALQGLKVAVSRQGRAREISDLDRRLKSATAKADIQVGVSCMCLQPH